MLLDTVPERYIGSSAVSAVTAGGDVECFENLSWQLLHQNPDISARFSSMDTDFEARSSPEPKMSLVRRKYIHSARFGCVHARGLRGDYFFPALVKYNNDIQNPTHVINPRPGYDLMVSNYYWSGLQIV